MAMIVKQAMEMQTYKQISDQPRVFVNPENLLEDSEIKTETTLEKVKRQYKQIQKLETEKTFLQAELHELEKLMKEYTINLH